MATVTTAVAQPPHNPEATQYLALVQEQAAQLLKAAEDGHRSSLELALWQTSCNYAKSNGVFSNAHDYNVCYHAFVIETPVVGFFGKTRLPSRLVPRGGALHMNGETYWAMAGDIKGHLVVDVDPIKHTVGFVDSCN
jgi:hypothetical protein